MEERNLQISPDCSNTNRFVCGQIHKISGADSIMMTKGMGHATEEDDIHKAISPKLQD